MSLNLESLDGLLSEIDAILDKQSSPYQRCMSKLLSGMHGSRWDRLESMKYAAMKCRGLPNPPDDKYIIALKNARNILSGVVRN